MIKKIWAPGLFSLLSAGLLGAFIWAPYLPRLASEGFPGQVWPVPGSYVAVSGGDGRLLQEAIALHGRAPQPWLEDLVSESGGKALLVYQDGVLELEFYADGFGSETKFNSYSMVKSLVGILVLKAIAEGKIHGVDVALGDLLPEPEYEALKDVTLRQLLDMESGIVFEVTGMKAMSGGDKDLERTMPNPFGPMARLHFSGPGKVLPGLTSQVDDRDVFNYQNINTVLLAGVLERVYGEPLDRIVSEKIWRPSGSASAQWRLYPDGSGVSAYCCLFATARDWVLVGRFLMENGNGSEAFLPADLWRAFLGSDLSADLLSVGDYSYHMRHDVLDRAGEPLQGGFTYFMGQGGQTLYLMPDQDLVVVRFGDRHPKLHSTLYAVWRSIKP